MFKEMTMSSSHGNSVQAAHGLIGDSGALQQLRADIQTAAESDARVLVLGETGSGKEVTSRLIHTLSPRQRRRFVALNCGGIPDQLLESELFGHVRGSFTGAFRDNPGLARAAEGGTLLLDEVGEMSLRMQAVVLRFVETGEVQPLGATSHDRLDVRLIAATHRDLRARIGEKEFREDLYYRLNVVPLTVPPLRERADDIVPLMHHYLASCSQAHRLSEPSLSAAAESRLRAYTWPGNVRELKNVAERLVVRMHGRHIGEADLPREILSACAEPVEETGDGRRPDLSGRVDEIWRRIAAGESFWSTAHAQFKAHDLTRNDVRELIRRGLAQTRGNYRQLVEAFNMESADYRRFLSFLYQYDCNLPFQPHRAAAQTMIDRTDAGA